VSLKDEFDSLRQEEAAGYVADLWPKLTEEERTQRTEYKAWERTQKGYLPRVPEGIPKPSTVIRPLEQLPANMLDWGPEEINFYRGLKDSPDADPAVAQKLSSAKPRWKGIPDVAKNMVFKSINC